MTFFKTILFLIVGLPLFSCNNNTHKEHGGDAQHARKVYTCPMDPEIISDKMSQCPKCGMDLVEKMSEGEKKLSDDLNFLLKPTNSFVVSQIKTVSLSEKDLHYEITATGTIVYDTRQAGVVSARVPGRIDKLYAKYRFQHIHKGDRLASIYSKELETEQENYLFLLKNDSENTSLIKAAEQKLSLLGLTQQQVDQIRASQKPFASITIYSPYTGHLHDIMNGSEQSNDGMAGTSMNRSAEINQELELKEGMYVAKGQTMFNIYNTSQVWALLHVYQDAQTDVKPGKRIDLQIDGLGTEERKATVSFVEPQVRDVHKGITVRVNLVNPNDKIKVGAVVRGRIAGSKKGLYLPAAAIVSLGMDKVCFIKDGKAFKAKRVLIGLQTDDWVEILHGLTPGDVVAENGQLLMDSESFIKIPND